MPGVAPMIATGLSPNTRAMSPPRLSQSIAFFITPGIELLYSGVTSSSPSAAAMRSLSAVTAAGMPCSLSTSPSYRGMPAIDAISTVVPAGARSAAARNSAAFHEPFRRLPAIPMMVAMHSPYAAAAPRPRRAPRALRDALFQPRVMT